MKTHQKLFAELENTNRRTLQLFEDLDESQLAVPYEHGINPPIWELGHSAFFYDYFLLRKYDDPNPVMPGFDEIWDSFEIHHRTRWKPGVVPAKQTTFDYYHKILDRVRNLLAKQDLTEDISYRTNYCLFHQNMHIESMILARQTLSYPAPLSYKEPPNTALTEEKKDIDISRGTYFIGIDKDSDEFSFDNERPGFHSDIDAFSISNQLVSNGEFLEFVCDEGGYRNSDNWSFDGVQWLDELPGTRSCPEYWSVKDSQWFERFFDREIPLDLHCPALHLNFWEAESYCKWAGRRLPTEFEWEAAASGSQKSHFPWGDEMDSNRVDMDAKSLGRLSTSALSDGQSESGCIQMLGTAWEWTSSQYLPFDGFAMDMYPYMSTLQFGDHKTTRGGSCATSSCLIRSTYRQAYCPGRSDVFAGFRTVKLV